MLPSWDGLDPEVQAAIIGALVTVITATLGAILILYQIGRQAQHALKQDKNNEAIKLKMQVYENVLSITREMMSAEVGLGSYISSFESDVRLCKFMHKSGYPWSAPKARSAALTSRYNALSRASNEVIGMIERWQIIDPRIMVFRTAINVAMHEIRLAYTEDYFHTALRLMPHEKAESRQGSLFPWSLPDDHSVENLSRATSNLRNAIFTLGGYMHDFQIEMQNILLGDLFRRSLPPRYPINPEVVVVRLENHLQLSAYFENDTAWGREKARTEARVRTELAGGQ